MDTLKKPSTVEARIEKVVTDLDKSQSDPKTAVKVDQTSIDDVAMDFEVPRFEPGDPAALKYLQEQGYVVFKSVLSEDAVIQAREMFNTWLEEVSPFRRDDSTTYDEDWVSDPSNGITTSYGVGHSDFMWFVRTRPKVMKAFAHIWGTPDLITSFDGCGVFRPWAYNPNWKTISGWWHVDQNEKLPSGKGYQCVQGLVNLYDCDETTGGLTVKPGTHKFHAEMCEGINWSNHYIPVKRDNEVLQMPARLVRCKAGDLCLWDSRTIHCNTPGRQKPDPMPKTWGLIRVACYICMVPRAKASFSTLATRNELYEDHRTTTHWPHIVGAYATPRRHAERHFARSEAVDWLIGNRPTDWAALGISLAPLIFAMVGKAMQS